ncbi:hypothetical protein EJ04DRAFT_284957 [Polyplosphaeria fusca]|uniref:Glycosyltransferase family 25 protein n=1 Tax=Polyplosphaeria fusca TaxID=682080 RepID=A0A9P4V697_9PLEO|nr:hypothetical protein EJ04DRAFT_284957 [Polyplosphaeria fusca]
MALGASYTGLTLDWIDGVSAEGMDERAYPPGDHREVSKGNKGSWRAHMNALREVIEQNLTTALIFEDDADWDFRIRGQLADFSHAARRMPSLIAQSEQLLLQAKTVPDAVDATTSPVEDDLAKKSTLSTAKSTIPKQEPYGQDWDILWLGHCGAALPPPSTQSPNRIAISNDVTTPPPQHLKPMSHARLDKIGSLYPPHTRVVHQVNTTLCTIAYAVTQSGARKLMYEFGIREFNKGYDFALSDYCNGLTRYATRETLPVCITVQPPIFSHFWPEKMISDIMGLGAGGRETGTRYVRWSVRNNLERLVRGEEGIVEQWGDEDKGTGWK